MPFVLPAVLIVAIPFSLLALLSIPYYRIFPDHHMHIRDLDGTERQRELLAKWRTRYSELGIFGRLRRAAKLLRRRAIR